MSIWVVLLLAGLVIVGLMSYFFYRYIKVQRELRQEYFDNEVDKREHTSFTN